MRIRGAFTLVEILIVVVILGILAAIIIPQFNSATAEAQRNATYTDLQKMRKAIEMYRIRHSGEIPAIVEVAGDPAASWGPLVGNTGDYMLGPPVNAWVGGVNARKVVVVPDFVPDAAYHTDYGWVFDPNSGQLYAGAFDGLDQPLPRP